MSADKQAGEQGNPEKGKQPAAQKERAQTKRQATQTQPALLGSDALLQLWEPFLLRTGARLGRLAGRSCCINKFHTRCIKERVEVGYEIYFFKHLKRTMLKRTSKRVKEIVDKMLLPAVVRAVRLSRSFWDDARNIAQPLKSHSSF